jgi:hypothetical protein
MRLGPHRVGSKFNNMCHRFPAEDRRLGRPSVPQDRTRRTHSAATQPFERHRS